MSKYTREQTLEYVISRLKRSMKDHYYEIEKDRRSNYLLSVVMNMLEKVDELEGDETIPLDQREKLEKRKKEKMILFDKIKEINVELNKALIEYTENTNHRTMFILKVTNVYFCAEEVPEYTHYDGSISYTNEYTNIGIRIVED